MSKFCVVALEQKNEEDPLTYSQFETFVNWLYFITESMYSDFETKFKFMQEQQDQNLQNERNVFDMDERLKSLSTNIVTMEAEMQENGEYLEQLEKMLQVLDNKQLEVSRLGLEKNPYESFGDLLKNTDNALQFLRQLIEDVNELEQTLHLAVNPYNTIAKILDCHLQLLQSTEKNIDKLIDKTATVEELYQQMHGS